MIIIRLIPFFLTLMVAGAVVLFSEMHSWSSAATTWALTAVLGGSTVIDLTLSRWWERSSRRRDKRRGAAHPVK